MVSCQSVWNGLYFWETGRKLLAFNSTGMVQMDNIKRQIKKIEFSLFSRFFSGKYSGKHDPIWIDFRITRRCNLRCIYCNIPDNPLKEFTTEEAKKVLDKIDGKGRWILITGGEPLLRDDIKEIIDHIVFSTELKVMLNSNLLLLTKRYDDVKNVDGFYFSIDGSKETHEKNKGIGSWDRMIEGIELLHKERRGKISMTTITNFTTIDDIRSVLEICRRYEIIPAFQMVRIYNMSRDADKNKPDTGNILRIFDYLIEQRKKGIIMSNSLKGLKAQKQIAIGRFNKSCYSGRLFAFIESDGTLGLCFSRPKDPGYLNLLDENISFKQALKAFDKVKPHIKRCFGCSCMAPVEFALVSPFDLDVINDNNKSFSRNIRLENEHVKRLEKEAHETGD
ncbi:MAG: radical SAM protein [Candidatus Woesearchaeota archaeon]